MVNDPVFEFASATITCTDDGQTTWQIVEEKTNRYIFNLCHPDIYAKAMTSALCKLLSTIKRSNKTGQATR